MFTQSYTYKAAHGFQAIFCGSEPPEDLPDSMAKKVWASAVARDSRFRLVEVWPLTSFIPKP